MGYISIWSFYVTCNFAILTAFARHGAQNDSQQKANWPRDWVPDVPSWHGNSLGESSLRRRSRAKTQTDSLLSMCGRSTVTTFSAVNIKEYTVVSNRNAWSINLLHSSLKCRFCFLAALPLRLLAFVCRTENPQKPVANSARPLEPAWVGDQDGGRRQSTNLQQNCRRPHSNEDSQS